MEDVVRKLEKEIASLQIQLAVKRCNVGGLPESKHLHGTNYSDWKFAMKSGLVDSGLWQCIMSSDVDEELDCCWQNWRTAFEQCSVLNRWTEQDKLQWLAVSLTGDAAWAFGQLTAEQRESYDSCITGLTTLLVPPNVEQLNLTLFRTRRKAKEEDWFAFARELSKLAAKAYPAFAPGVRDALSLERFLTELGPEEWASTVRRANPSSLMDAQLIETTGAPLTVSQEGKLRGMLSKFRSAFAASEFDIGRTSVLKHDIIRDSNRPVRHPLLRLSPLERNEVSQLIQRMLDNKIIEPSNSPWAAGIVPVRKKDGSIRLCVDYRKLNEVSRRDAYPIPRVDETLEALARARYYGYWQVELTDAAKEKTAFITHDGLFQFNVMPFGLTGAPATFQRLMERVLAGLKWSTCLVYLDDIIVFSLTAEEHIEHLAQVLSRLQEAGFKVNSRKCKLFSKEVCYLGHIVSEKGIEPDPSLTEKMRTYPVPKCLTEVQRFLGMASYYRKFIKNFAAIAKPLHQLTEKRKPSEWSLECTEPSTNCDVPFILDTDASDTAIGAVLSQTDVQGREHPVAFASRTLTRAERRYCVTRREMLAVITFVEQFRPYPHRNLRYALTTGPCNGYAISKTQTWARWQQKLQQYDFVIEHRAGSRHANMDTLSRIPRKQCGRSGTEETSQPVNAVSPQKFTLRTDHGSLQWLRNFKNPDGQWARWQQKLQQYDFVIEHRAGSRHANMDTLSRIPRKQCGRSGTEETRAQSSETVKLEKSINANWHRLAVRNGILVRKWLCEDYSGFRWQVVVPKCMISRVLKQAHEGVTAGHLGMEKTTERIRERFYWLGYRTDIKGYVGTCYECNTRNGALLKGRAPLHPLRATRRWQRIAIDVLGPLATSETGNRYILVVMDCFSKFAEAFPIPNQEAKTVTAVLVCRRRSIQIKEHSSMCTELGIQKTRTTAYHPSGNGQVERMNRTLGNMLAKTVEENHRRWDVILPKLMMAYRASVQSSIQTTPYAMVFGEHCRLPEDVGRPEENNELSPEDHVRQLKKVLGKIHVAARRRLNEARRRQKQQYDKTSRGEPFRVGGLMFLQSLRTIRRGQCRKFARPWVGPYRVIAKPSAVTYRIQHLKNRRDQQTDQRALAKINLSIKPCAWAEVRKAKTAKEAWESLRCAYEDKGIVRRIDLYSSLFKTRFEDCNHCGSMTNYIDRIYCGTAGSHWKTLLEQTKQSRSPAATLLQFRPLILGIQGSNQKISVEFVKGLLLQTNVKDLAVASGNYTSCAYVTRRQNKKKSEHSELKYFGCKQIGHVKARCPYRLKKDRSFAQRVPTHQMSDKQSTAVTNFAANCFIAATDSRATCLSLMTPYGGELVTYVKSTVES
ncbi:LOW QUALITY PROTEIN: hypothetical protein M514_27243 [Trichuris suis]|uniref:RNA-directed DNA polymerase n=1 Tax=Trichuris suis TaxID=68888 RepID=A0A085MTN1_9BILA|nr:LOW QUALITY PROTEIN: hypothetical protein M514_27243 [Trichuris suis]